MSNLDIYNQVRSVPAEALKKITGGRLKGMSDINPMWRIKMLTEVFGLCGVGWKTEIVEKRLERGHGDEIVCFVDINLYVKIDGAWSDPIPGMGGSSFVTKEAKGLHTSDECFKMAYTDAISVACKSLGFAADVYFSNDRTKYSQSNDDQEKPNDQEKPADRDKPKEVKIGEVKAKWIVLAGSEDGFDDWYKKKVEEGHSHDAMNKFLAKKIMDKKKGTE